MRSKTSFFVLLFVSFSFFMLSVLAMREKILRVIRHKEILKKSCLHNLNALKAKERPARRH